MPLVYTGQEAGNTKRLSFFEKDLVEWKEHKLFNIYSKLFELKKNYKALQNGNKGGELKYIEASDYKSIFAFTRNSEKDKILAVFNLSNKTVSVDLMGETLQGSYKNFFTGKLETFLAKESLQLSPWEYRIYTK